MVAEIEEAFTLLAEQPGLGHFRLDLADESVRFWTVKPYHVIYLSGKKPLQVVRVLYLSITDHISELVVADQDGRNPKQVTKTGAILSSPRWLPDGKTIQFLRAGDFLHIGRATGNSTIWTVQSDGSNPREISPKSDPAMMDQFIDPYQIQMLRDWASVPQQ